MRRSRRATRPYHVPALERGLDIVEALAGEERGPTVTEVSRRFAIPKSSTFGILQTLRARGYLDKSADDRYGLTLKIFGLGNARIDGFDLRRRLYPLLVELTQKSGITGHIAVLDQGYAVHVEKAEVMGAIRLTTWIGKRMHLHSTAIGKALIAWRSTPDVRRILAGPGLPRQTARTITDPKELAVELARVRSLGYAVSNEENEEGVRAVAAPIFDHAGKPIAAVNLGGSTLQIRMKDVPRLGELVRAYAGRMSGKLGYTRRS